MVVHSTCGLSILFRSRSGRIPLSLPPCPCTLCPLQTNEQNLNKKKQTDNPSVNEQTDKTSVNKRTDNTSETSLNLRHQTHRHPHPHKDII